MVPMIPERGLVASVSLVLVLFLMVNCEPTTERSEIKSPETIKYPLSNQISRTIIDSDTRAVIVLIDSLERSRKLPAYQSFPDEVKSFVQSVNFDKTILLLVGTSAPNTCYQDLRLETLQREGKKLTGRFVAVRPEGAGQFCGQAITNHSRLVKVPHGPTSIERAELTVVDGWDHPWKLETTPDSKLPVGENQEPKPSNS